MAWWLEAPGLRVRPPWLWGETGPHEDTVPVAEEEQKDGQGSGQQLQPAPVREDVGQSGEQHKPNGRGHLVEDGHRPSVGPQKTL